MGLIMEWPLPHCVEAVDPEIASPRTIVWAGRRALRGRPGRSMAVQAVSPLAPWQIGRIRERANTLEDGLPRISELALLCGIGESHLRRTSSEMQRVEAARRGKPCLNKLVADVTWTRRSCRACRGLIGRRCKACSGPGDGRSSADDLPDSPTRTEDTALQVVAADADISYDHRSNPKHLLDWVGSTLLA